MNYKLLVILIFSSAVVWNCSSSGKKISPKSDKITPHTAIRKLEIDMIKVGDILVKVEAVMGKPTEKTSDPQGTIMTWWLVEEEGIDESAPEQYRSLKEKPSDTSGHKFLKVIIDPKNKVTSKDFSL